MTHLAFDQDSKVVFASSTKLDVSVAGSTITWATLDGEYDASYAYKASYSPSNVAQVIVDPATDTSNLVDDEKTTLLF